MERRQAALLGGGELGGNLEVGESLQSRVDLRQVVFQCGGLGGEGMRLVASEGGARISQQSTPIAIVGDGVGGEKPKGLCGTERIAFDDTDQLLLFGGGEVAQVLGQSGADPGGGESVLATSAEFAADGLAAFHPLAAFAKQTGNLRHVEMVVVDQRADHASFIERGDGAQWSVGGQQQALVLAWLAGGLDHHRHLALLALDGRAQALEAVDDLEAIVFDRHHADRQRRRLSHRQTARRAGAQGGVAGAQPIDGNRAHRFGVRGHG